MREEKVYQVQFYDACCSPIGDGPAEFYTEDIHQFKENFMRVCPVESVRQDFLRALSGESVYVYYDDVPRNEMLQEDIMQIYDEAVFDLDNLYAEVHNAYMWPSFYRAQHAKIEVMSICFKGEYKLIGKYHLYGVARNRNPYEENDTEDYEEIHAYGNAILDAKTVVRRNHPKGRERIMMGPPNNEFNCYKDNELWSFCWAPFQYGESPILIPKELTASDFDYLLRDISGEAG